MNTSDSSTVRHTQPVVSANPDALTQTLGAVVLAGGLARRMGGQDKGLIKLAGLPMVHYALAVVLPLVSRCVINANRNADDYQAVAQNTVSQVRKSFPVAQPVSVIPDTLSGHLGPLAGLSAGIEALQTDYIFMCPCDSPHLQAQLVLDLWHSCRTNDADIAVAHDGERLQPVFCVVNRRIKDSLDRFLASGNRKIDQWFEEHAVNHVSAKQYLHSFVNINTEDDRARAELALLDKIHD